MNSPVAFGNYANTCCFSRGSIIVSIWTLIFWIQFISYLIDDTSMLVQIMAWRHQTTGHYLVTKFQTVTRGQWVNDSPQRLYWTEGSALIRGDMRFAPWLMQNSILDQSSQGTNYFMSDLCSERLLTLNVRGPNYLGLIESISWLLMPWLLTSTGHQQPWYWLNRIGRFLSYLRKDFNYLRRINVENDTKCKYMFMFPLKNSARNRF